ncbi:MAG: ATP-dependent Clp protease proteolytic subunit [Planctomycetota bacterium]
MQNPSQRNPLPDSLLEEEEEETCQPTEKGGTTAYLERQLLESRTLLLSGPVTDRMLRDATVRCFAMEQRDAKKPITVVINSPGGSADSGFAIYDMLRFVKPPVVTVVNGLCASAGILIHLAADKKHRFCLPESRFMIHQPSTMGRGSASDLDITAREILKLRDRYNRIIAEATGKTEAEVLEDARRDFWLDAGQALEYGLVHKIVQRREDLPA